MALWMHYYQVAYQVMYVIRPKVHQVSAHEVVFHILYPMKLFSAFLESPYSFRQSSTI